MKNVIMTMLAFAVVAMPAAHAQDAASLDQLLKMVEQGRTRDASEFRQREQQFAAARAEQQNLVNQANQRKRTAEGRSESLEGAFEENETRTAELTGTLSKRMGSLRELFGVLQQVAGDTQGLFDNSLTNIQYPDRGKFLSELAAKMGTSTKLASMEEIERLWFELQREMTESGKIVKFQTTVITTEGDQAQREIARVGLFNVASDGAYLRYTPETGMVSEIERQPQQARFLNSTGELLNASSGMVSFGIDPTRGQILGLLVQRPNLQERIAQGGVVGYIIIGLGLVGLLIALERLVTLGIAGGKVKSQLKNKEPRTDNPLGRVLKAAEANSAADRETLELKLSEAIMQETPSLNRSLLFLKIISVVAPLLGLLGTVTGMIVTFQAITLYGTGDPKLMAGGISQALVTTVLGLVVAIPTVLLHTLVSGRSRRIVHVLQEQSAGIIAERAEADHTAASARA